MVFDVDDPFTVNFIKLLGFSRKNFQTSFVLLHKKLLSSFS